MALEAFVAGRYVGTYAAVDVGITREGYLLAQESMQEPVSPSDAYGDSILDGVYRGGNVYIQFDSKCFKAGAVTPFWPWGALGQMQCIGSAVPGGQGPIGRLASAVAAALVLTAVTGTAYNTSGALAIAVLTSAKTILAPNSSAQLLFHSRLREVPVRLLALPQDSGGTTANSTTWFTYT